MQIKKLLILGFLSLFVFTSLFIFIMHSPKSDSIVSMKKGGLLQEISKSDHIRGAENPQVLLIEYSDFECPFCKKFHSTLTQLLKDKNLKVAIVFRHFPLPFHQNAQIEAEASECVYSLGGSEKFWQFHDLLFERTKSNGIGFSPSKLAPLATEIGLNAQGVQTCIDARTYKKRVDDDFNTGSRLGIRGTPTTVIATSNGKRQTVVGSLSLSDMKQIINDLLK